MRTKLREFKLFAMSCLDIERASNEEDAITAVMAALEKIGIGDALLSLYDTQTRRIRGCIASGATWIKLVDTTDEEISGKGILACVLKNDCPEFIEDSTKDSRCNQEVMRASGIKAQYVLPMRINDELIGTLQVNMGQRSLIEEDEVLILNGFASHLAVNISRVRSIRMSLELTNQVMTASRFITAETLSGMAVHSLGHKLDGIIRELHACLKRKEVLENKYLLSLLEKWHDTLLVTEKDVRNTLRFIRTDRGESNSAPIELHREIQSSIDMWMSLFRQNKVTIHSSLQADNSVCYIPAHAFREIMSVLLVNSVQAYARQIHLKTYNKENYYSSPQNFIITAFCLECSDNGIGLVTDKPEEIFESNYTTKPEKFGTGLGLFIARRLARESGGDLMIVETHGASKGTTFRLTLPLKL